MGVAAEKLEGDFLNLLALMQPTDEFLSQQHDVAVRAWEQRQSRTEQDRRSLTMRLQEQTTLNRDLVLAKLKGEVSQADFDIVKPGIEQAIADMQAAHKALEMESGTMSAFIEATERKTVDLVRSRCQRPARTAKCGIW
ncbi:MAG TPA: hypothetical protein VFK06_25215 [Candidatus Angelobacter sp.]|nr:hypothetical protein [Candidatus Angelobacter sp.]